MSVTNTTEESPLYLGNGTTTAFSTAFMFLANDDVQVIMRDQGTLIDTIMQETTDYTLTGAGVSGGGTVTFVSPPAAGKAIKIIRNITIDQQTDYVEVTAFPASTHERIVDRLTMIAQQLNSKLGRSPLLPATSELTPLEFPDGGASKAGYIIRWDAVTGEVLEAVTPSEASTGTISVDSAVTTRVTQVAHGFVVGDVLYHTGMGYAKAKADSVITAEVIGVVMTVLSTDKFIIQTSGTVITLSGLTPGSVYFLSDATAGLATTTQPSTIGHITKPVYTALTPTSAALTTQMRGVVIDESDLGNLTVTDTLTVGGNPTRAGRIVLLEDQDNGNNSLTINAPASIAANYSVTWPADNGTGNKYLANDGSGNLSWANSTMPGGSDTQVQFNNSGAFGGDSGFTYAGGGTATLTTELKVGGNSTDSGKITLFEDSDNGSNTFTLRAAPSIPSNFTATWPSDNGTNTYLLRTNGSGTLSWTAPAGSSTSGQILFNNGGNITGSAALTVGANGTVNFGDASNVGSVDIKRADSSPGGVLLRPSINLSTAIALGCPNTNFTAYRLTLPDSVGATGQYLTTTVSGTTSSLEWTTLPAPAPAGSTTQIQYNNGGVLAGDAGLTYNGTGQVTLGATGSVQGGLLLHSNGANQGILRLYEASTNGTNRINIRAHTTLASDYTIALPDTMGTTGYALTSASSSAGNVQLAWTPLTQVATQSDQETGASTTAFVSPGRQHFHASASKVWAVFNSSGTLLDLSYNITSITDTGTGDWTVNIGTDMSYDNYPAFATGGKASGNLVYNLGTMTGGTAQILCVTLAGVAADPTTPDKIHFHAYGDI